MRTLPIAGATAILLTTIWPAQSQEVPNLNVDPV
jgi:hypothetical protein